MKKTSNVLLISLGACAALLVSALPALAIDRPARDGSGPAPGRSALSAPPLAGERPAREAPEVSPARIDELRADLEALRLEYLALGEALGPRVHEEMERGLARLDRVSDEELAELVDAGVKLDELIEATRDLTGRVEEGAARPAGVDAAKSFPSAPYSRSCGSQRTDPDAQFVARSVLETAEGVHSIASRGCDQVVVAAGFGGNAATACIVADTVLAAARYAYDTFDFCDVDIDEAEIRGSYLRLGALKDDVDQLSFDVEQSRAENVAITENSTARIITNDDRNLERALERSDENTALVLTELEGSAQAATAREIENFLRMRECPAWLYTPASMGGRVETVLALVEDVIDDADALGSVSAERRASARALLATASALSAERPLDARSFCQALIASYAEATPSSIDRVPLPAR